VAINIVGHGFGPKSTLAVTRAPPPSGEPPTVAFLTGGRAVDVNHDGSFSSSEGSQALGDLRFVVQNRDAMRQNVADYVQLIRVIEAGVDWDGDGVRDLDPGRIYFAGFSLTSSVVLDLFAIEPRIRAATFTGIGSGPSPQLLPANRGLLAQFLDVRRPTLINPPFDRLGNPTPVITSLGGIATAPPFFNENIPDRDRPVLVNTVAGALPLQAYIDRAEWVQATTAPGTFAPYLRASPLPAIPPRPFLVQMSRGDVQIANTATAELVRAGDFADRLTMYRHDLFSGRLQFKNPHTFVIRTDPVAGVIPPLLMRPIALEAQDQIGAFLASDGSTTIDPDGPDVLFEVPASFVPADLGFVL
jgi:hypothetical protein